MSPPKLVGTYKRASGGEAASWYTEEGRHIFEKIEEPSCRQVGGSHYKDMAIEPSEFIFKNGMNWLEGNAIKYICRYKQKGGKQDIDKAIHYLQLLKEWEYESER